MELDIVFLQEVENEQLSLSGYNVICNVDHSRRGTAIALRDHIAYSTVEKSLDGRLTALRVQNTTLCCVYAPSGSALRLERERFFNHTLAFYLRHRTEHTVLAGDFNCVLRQCDATGHNTSPALLNAVQQLRLRDVWVVLQPAVSGHTYITQNSSSRLDRVYVCTSLSDQLRSADTHVCCFSDHKAVSVRLCLPHLGRAPGCGFWSLKPHVLTAEHIEDFQYQWQFWTRERRNYSSWMEWWMSYAKPKIKRFFRLKSKSSFDDFYREHQRLYAQLRLAYDGYYLNPDMLTTINNLKGKLLKLQRDFSHLFTRINETRVCGEPLTIFQLGERARKKTTITQLRSESGELLDSSGVIEQRLQQYFSELYEAGDVEEAAGDVFFCDRVVPEIDEANTNTMSDITTAEIYAAIKTSAPRKSPGPDGLPKEFYLRTFDVIHRELNLVLNEALATNFPSEFVDGVIVLVKKKDSDDTAKSYRPISLLNFDYKILARVLKARIERVMIDHRILSAGQKCSNSDRNIFQATLALKDRIAELNRRGRRGKLVSFDLDHAFDRVDHTFLFRTMRSLGFNPGLVTLLSRIAAASSSRLLVNGRLSPAFSIQRSVRQGDPLSMHLFVLYLHPLVSRLERVAGSDLVVAYADDISVVSTSTHKLDSMRALFSVFERASGAKLNLRKTTSIDVGLVGDNGLRITWLQTVETMKVLGVIYANSIRVMIRRNWDELVVKFARLIWLHATRSLTILQKVVLLNTFISSRMWYLSSIIPPYQEHTNKITRTMSSFLWRGIPARLPIQQLARDREQGGLNLHLPALKCKALLINRHLREIESMPYYKSFILQANPNPTNPPSQYPCLKLVYEQFLHMPRAIQRNPSADLLHRLAVEQQTMIPKVERNNPDVNWTRVWQNIGFKQLTSIQRSTLYLAVNEKVEHRKLMFTIRRTDGENCTSCGAAVETLQHKFCECRRVADAWLFLRNRITTIFAGRFSPTFEDLLRPSLEGAGQQQKVKTLILFVEYLTFVLNSENGVV